MLALGQPPSGIEHAFVTVNNVMIDLNTLLDPMTGAGWILDRGADINDVGQITGEGTINGSTHAFLLTPAQQ